MVRITLPACFLLSLAATAQAQSPSDLPAPDAGSPPEAVAPAGAAPQAAVPDDAAPQPAPADSGDGRRRGLGVAVKVSTLGIGVEGIYSIVRHFNVRGQANFFNYDQSFNKDGNDYDGKLKLLSFGVLGDVYPFAGIPVIGDLRLTGGGYVNNNKIDLGANCNGNGGCSVGDLTVTGGGANPAHLTGQMDFRHFSPYAGFGFGNAMQGGHFHFAFDIGALFQGKPKVNLQAEGEATITDKKTGISRTDPNVGADPVVASNLATEQATLSGDVKSFQIYPVIALTVGYRFDF